MVKVVINRCYGGFCLSDEAMRLLCTDEYDTIDRFDHNLVKVVEELGDRVNGSHARLCICEFPSYIEREWVVIAEYDGLEHAYVDFAIAYKKAVDKYYPDKDKLYDEITRIKEYETEYQNSRKRT